MKITKRQLKRIIKEAQWGNFTGGAASLDVPMRDSGPVPRDQLRKLADIFMKDMGMSPEEVLSKPEFVEQGITDLRQLEESKMKITRKQLRRIIRESISEAGGFRDYGEEEVEYTSRAGTLDETNPEYADNDEWEDSEYKRGYQDALDDLPMADNATSAYDDGYETASSELEADLKAAE